MTPLLGGFHPERALYKSTGKADYALINLLLTFVPEFQRRAKCRLKEVGHQGKGQTGGDDRSGRKRQYRDGQCSGANTARQVSFVRQELRPNVTRFTTRLLHQGRTKA